jgi:hypothetical protein
MTAKLDVFKANRAEYATPRSPVLLRVAPAQYLAFDGEGDPNGPAFAEAIGALYSMAYTIKMRKKREGADYKVAPLEGLWWSGEGDEFPPPAPGDWHWTALIRTPELVGPGDLETAASELERKGKGGAVRRVRLERLEEGECVQVLHVGPYSAELPTIAAMKEFARSRGLHRRGHHHEIYLSDPRRVPPERLRTILRQPVA